MLVPIYLAQSVLVLNAVLALLCSKLGFNMSALLDVLLHWWFVIWNFVKDFKTILGNYLSSTHTDSITASTILIVELIRKTFQILTWKRIVIIIILESCDFFKSWNFINLHRFHLLLDDKITFTISTKNSNIFFGSTFKILCMKNFLELIKLELLFLIILAGTARLQSMVLWGSHSWHMGVWSSNLSVVVGQSVVYQILCLLLFFNNDLRFLKIATCLLAKIELSTRWLNRLSLSVFETSGEPST